MAANYLSYDPQQMLLLLEAIQEWLLEGHLSCKIATKLHEDVAFRVLAADNFPAHRMIRDFRANHPREFCELFVQVIKLSHGHMV